VTERARGVSVQFPLVLLVGIAVSVLALFLVPVIGALVVLPVAMLANELTAWYLKASQRRQQQSVVSSVTAG
jgi:hypothetical protein